jgi:hypothetical protein
VRSAREVHRRVALDDRRQVALERHDRGGIRLARFVRLPFPVHRQQLAQRLGVGAVLQNREPLRDERGHTLARNDALDLLDCNRLVM